MDMCMHVYNSPSLVPRPLSAFFTCNGNERWSLGTRLGRHNSIQYMHAVGVNLAIS